MVQSSCKRVRCGRAICQLPAFTGRQTNTSHAFSTTPKIRTSYQDAKQALWKWCWGVPWRLGLYARRLPIDTGPTASIKRLSWRCQHISDLGSLHLAFIYAASPPIPSACSTPRMKVAAILLSSRQPDSQIGGERIIGIASVTSTRKSRARIRK